MAQPSTIETIAPCSNQSSLIRSAQLAGSLITAITENVYVRLGRKFILFNGVVAWNSFAYLTRRSLGVFDKLLKPPKTASLLTPDLRSSWARSLEKQKVEIQIKSKALNTITSLGMPDNYVLTWKPSSGRTAISGHLIHATKPIQYVNNPKP